MTSFSFFPMKFSDQLRIECSSSFSGCREFSGAMLAIDIVLRSFSFIMSKIVFPLFEAFDFFGGTGFSLIDFAHFAVTPIIPEKNPVLPTFHNLSERS